MSDADKEARWKANPEEIAKIEAQIKNNFFTEVFYCDQNKKHPLVNKTKARMPAYTGLVASISTKIGLKLPAPRKPFDYKSVQPFIIVSVSEEVSN